MAETSFHLAVSREPTRGSRSTQSGGGGTDHVASHCAPLAMSCEYATIVVRASASGTIRPSSNTIVITATANPRRPHSADWTRSIRGQVATTIMVAQTNAGRNGRKTQKVATIIPAMNSTASVGRARSREIDVTITVSSPSDSWPRPGSQEGIKDRAPGNQTLVQRWSRSATMIMGRWSYCSPRGGEASLRGECTLSLAAENRNVRSADERRPSRARRALGHHLRRRRRHPAATAHPPDLGRHTPRPRLAGGGGRTGRPL